MSKELFDSMVALAPSITHERVDAALKVDLLANQKYAIAQGATNTVNVALMCANSYTVRSSFMTPEEYRQFDIIVASVGDKIRKAQANPAIHNKVNAVLWTILNKIPF